MKRILETQKDFKKENVDYDSEHSSLKENDEDLIKIVHKFTQGKKNFDLMPGNQKCAFDKGRIRYKSFLKQKSFFFFFC